MEKYNDDDRMKQLPALNKDKVLNEDKPLHMNTDGLFFPIKFGFFFSHSPLGLVLMSMCKDQERHPEKKNLLHACELE